MFAGAGTGVSAQMNFMVTRSITTSSVIVAPGDVTYVIYNLTYPSNMAISLELQSEGRKIEINPNGLCGNLGSQFGLDFIDVENCSTTDNEYEYHLFILRIDESAENQTVMCNVLVGNTLGNIVPCGGNTTMEIRRRGKITADIYCTPQCIMASCSCRAGSKATNHCMYM